MVKRVPTTFSPLTDVRSRVKQDTRGINNLGYSTQPQPPCLHHPAGHNFSRVVPVDHVRNTHLSRHMLSAPTSSSRDSVLASPTADAKTQSKQLRLHSFSVLVSSPSHLHLLSSPALSTASSSKHYPLSSLPLETFPLPPLDSLTTCPVKTLTTAAATLSSATAPNFSTNRTDISNAINPPLSPPTRLLFFSPSLAPCSSPPPLGLDLTLPLACLLSSSSSIGASLPPRSDHLLALAPVNVSDAIYTTTSPPSHSIPSLPPRTAEQANTSAVATFTLATIQQPILEATAELPSPSTSIPPPSPAAKKPLRVLTPNEVLARPCQSCSMRSPTDPPSLLQVLPALAPVDMLTKSPVNTLATAAAAPDCSENRMEGSNIITTTTTTTYSPSSHWFLPPLAPIQDHLAQHLSDTSLPVFSDFDIAAIGSITIFDDTIESPEPQLAAEDSEEALQWDKECQEYYNNIQEELQQANSDATEIKKKKKKKKKASNPTATPNNPVLFYV
ncbi:hypothetical protein PCANC_05024 [Puccinia coronata f. sp. avenae]|uniref:Uncharacterized protein n=1 Tax=Puccinia coronata f. sp. avenae TaxID=200324 RepID=A0A2N5T7P1_9BASI|nr:hypothetical protein PCANC_05024 [Puccinia coronata f. sp. avenae]